MSCIMIPELGSSPLLVFLFTALFIFFNSCGSTKPKESPASITVIEKNNQEDKPNRK